jgi:hypothetical protein
VSPVVLDVDGGGWRRESRLERTGIVSIESGDRESGRDWDWELERGVEMVGVDVILVLAAIASVDVEEWTGVGRCNSVGVV